MRSFDRSLVIPFLFAPAALAVACGGSTSASPSKGGGEDGGLADGGSNGDSGGDGGGNTISAHDAGSGTVDAGSSSGDSGSVKADAGASGDATFSVAAHPPYPTIDYGGERLLVAPKVVSIMFKGDPFEASLSTFGAGLTQTPWWTTVTSQYCQPDAGCIGDGPTGVTVILDAGAATEYDDGVDGGGTNFQTWLTSLLSSSAVPANDSNTLYMIYMPSTTTINGGTGAMSCVDYSGYHDVTSTNVVYGISMECPAASGSPAYALPDITVTTAHEVVEAATDGIFTQDGTGWGWALDWHDPNAWGWMDQAYTELADMCDDNYPSDYWDGGTFAYERIWSLKAAAANQPPCMPLPPGGETYFNAAPAGAFFELNVGESITVPVTAFSTSARANWTLLAYDGTATTTTSYATVSFPGGKADSTFGGSAVSVNNGTVAQLTITLTSDPSGLQNGETSSGEANIMLASYDGTDYTDATDQHFWPIAVMTRAAAMDAGVTLFDGGVPAIQRGRGFQAGAGTSPAPKRIARPRHYFQARNSR